MWEFPKNIIAMLHSLRNNMKKVTNQTKIVKMQKKIHANEVDEK